jgi:glutamine amidotransferase
MCRLLAYVGEPIGPDQLVFGGSHSLYEQSWAPQELLSGSVNADGYGVVWYTDTGPTGEPTRVPVRLAEARPIWYDRELRSTLSATESTCVVAALRNGSVGMPVDRSGLLPLVLGSWSFVLNGFVPDFHADHMRALRAELPDDLYSELRGSSDSETLFLMTIAEIRKGKALAQALEATALRVKASVGTSEAQLNMVISDGTRAAAVRTSTTYETNSLYLAKHPPFAPRGVVLASEPPDTDDSWTPVGPHTSLTIEEDGSVHSAPVA